MKQFCFNRYYVAFAENSVNGADNTPESDEETDREQTIARLTQELQEAKVTFPWPRYNAQWCRVTRCLFDAMRNSSLPFFVPAASQLQFRKCRDVNL